MESAEHLAAGVTLEFPMSQQKMTLQTLRIAHPCPASWENMVGDDRVRFCQECQLYVYNVSAMRRQEAEALLANQEGRLCFRLYRRADGTVLTQDCPVCLRAARQKLAFVLGALAAALIACLAILKGIAGGDGPRAKEAASVRERRTGEETLVWLRQHEPIKTVLDWLDPPPSAPDPENLCCDTGW